ncbi:trypsin-like serine peptidase [Kutzneria kofuensis]|uniref:V8-like Glu-specific endopeptidase n=1 Tax=Kutzneria kofuensis TaxID=103725 RepID=A0A7W9KES2_9PSEU|nr:trypsin-like peptidase domain-containing protein [Kutzneria kofuensis]MBB5891285.1 V8-like Glu-specific endopeptidase [Kutzneria kofuensis]
MSRAVLVFAAVTTLAAPVAGADPAPSTQVDTVTAADQAVALAYWTPERMRQVGADATEPGEQTAKPWAEPAPKGVGRFFFTEVPGGDSWCTATAVPSGNKDTVVTAAHCVHPGFTRDDVVIKATNIVFVPGYDRGKAPLGVFAARAFVVPTEYSLTPRDMAMVVFGPRNGQHVADVAGTQKIAFGTRSTGGADIFGYPGSKLAHGEFLLRCTVTATRESDSVGDTWSSPCDMAGGSSGGPWLTGFDGRSGTVFSVTSKGSLDDDLRTTSLTGAPMGDVAKQVYDQASAI